MYGNLLFYTGTRHAHLTATAVVELFEDSKLQIKEEMLRRSGHGMFALLFALLFRRDVS